MCNSKGSTKNESTFYCRVFTRSKRESIKKMARSKASIIGKQCPSLIMNILNPQEGDLFIDSATDKTFYFTGDRWIDITSNHRKLWNEEPVGIGLTSNELGCDLNRGS